jgi:hypothetical protein
MMKLIVAFPNFEKAPKNNSVYGDHVHLPPCDLVSVTEPFQGFSSNAVQVLFTKICGANESFFMKFGDMRAHDLFARFHEFSPVISIHHEQFASYSV